MEIGAGNILDWILYFLLIFVRILSTFALSPVFGRAMPNIAKIVFSLALSYIVLYTVPPSEPTAYNMAIEFVVAVMKEIILGLIFGFIILMFMNVVYTSGRIIDLQMGFSFAQVYNPVTGAQSPVTGTIMNIFLVLMFFVTDSHLILFRVLYDTFTVLPPGKAVIDPNIAKVAAEAFIRLFEISFQIAMPVLIAEMIAEILLGVIMKAIPNVNFFAIGFPVKVAMGLIIMMAVIPVFAAISNKIFEEMYGVIQKIFDEMGRVTVG
ncbi:MAG: flagellar biosynthetic protein FliR [Oscillospiraceae bacterium]|nr:flagellar biosynthetic protein FliR [Oscillospiraceae bacterium]